jgi:molybdate transport system ATP-binding protein
VNSSSRLVVDAEKRLTGFGLNVRLEAGQNDSGEAETLVLFGPSGAGKTTTLNLIAGLASPDAGEITLDGETLFRRARPGSTVDVPARRRRVGYVFQSYALFPHMTALQNVAYPLWRAPNGPSRAGALVERMHLAHLADHYPGELSGGQQQRVALARALATEPRLLLLDEPFSALDAAVREHLQRDLRALQAELGLLVIYVTHRLEDAFVLGDRLAVVRDGCIAQAGRLEDVLRYPASPEVAQIMGIRNLFRARVTAVSPEALHLDWSGLSIEAPPRPADIGAEVIAYIRPEEVKLLYPDRPVSRVVGQNQADATVLDNRPGAGMRTLYLLLANGAEIEVRFPNYAYAPLQLDRGAHIRISLRRDALVLLDRE